ncbi:MAG: ATP/GTP-binding protein [Clostridia bacterium]|nr:ATP/GTP-binding protein [Clostridia bacterium]
MLIKFKISNFLSFDDAQEISMISGRTRGKEDHIQTNDDLKLLKFSALFGANASGKSSLLRAIDFGQGIITKGIRFTNNMYCKINSKNKDKITTFDFEIMINDKYYSYGFDVLLSKNSIKAEWLYELNKNGEENKIFVREVNKEIELNEKYFNNQISLERLKIYAMDIQDQDNVLFLTVMNRNKDALYQANNNIVIFRDIYNWFSQALVVIPPEGKMIDDSYYASEENLEKITEIVSKFGTGISKCKIEPVKMDELATRIPSQILNDVVKFTEKNYMDATKQGDRNVKSNTFLRANNELYIFEKISAETLEIKTIKFEHINNDGEYSFSEESDGTRRVLDLIEILLNDTTTRVYLIDELDRCLHPQLTYKFVETFLRNNNRNNIQLIVTTHESRLLDFELLRRDEIWFADREKNGPTKLYSLEDYNERFDRKIDKAYLDGRYGGVPIFEALFPIGDDK